jgi:SAM-dependent methyltransferase
VKDRSAALAVSCPVCRKPTTQIYLDDEDMPLVPSTIGSSREHTSPGRILRCRSCRFGFRQMRSSPSQLLELYRQMDPRVYKSELRGRERTAKSHLRIVSRHIRAGRLLDVGCASGLFLQEARKAGWDITGVEPNEALYKDARERLSGEGEIEWTTLEMAHLESGFDVITAWDVLEHVPDPKTFLQLCRSLLRSDGYLFLNVPDLDSKPAQILGPRWPLLLPEHLNYFNRGSLCLCANGADLRPIRFGQRPAWFSIKYLAYRISQHGVLGSNLLRKISNGPLGDMIFPVSLGETFAVFRPS